MQYADCCTKYAWQFIRLAVLFAFDARISDLFLVPGRNIPFDTCYYCNSRLAFRFSI